MPYMNVTEVESALIGLSAAHPSLCELITLPNLTIEGRTTHAVRLGTQPANMVDAFYLTGGVHAKEWSSCEILINLATDLCDAYAQGAGVGYGGKYFSAAEVKSRHGADERHRLSLREPRWQELFATYRPSVAKEPQHRR